MSDQQPNRGARPTRRQDDDGERARREGGDGPQRDRRPPRPAREDGEERRRRPEQQHDGDRQQRPARQDGDRAPQSSREGGERPPQRNRDDGDRQHGAVRDAGDRPQRPSRDEGDRRNRDGGDRGRDRDERPFDAVVASRLALDALQTMTNRTAEGVIGVERDDEGGWVVVVELLETARIPTTADVLGEYEVEIAPDRTLRSYNRRARYTRASTMSDS